MRTVDDEALQENSGHNLTEAIVFDDGEEVEQEGAVPVGMGVRVTKMQDHRTQEVMLPFNVQIACEILQSNHTRIARDENRRSVSSFRLSDRGYSDIDNQSVD